MHHLVRHIEENTLLSNLQGSQKFISLSEPFNQDGEISEQQHWNLQYGLDMQPIKQNWKERIPRIHSNISHKPSFKL